MGNDRRVDFDLFIDESGTFMETSTEREERARVSPGSRAPSQIVGVLAPRGVLTPKLGRNLLTAAFAQAGLPDTGQVHGMDIPRGDAYERLVGGALIGLTRRGLQPVRLVNREQVSYGDRVANYTNLVAELLLRIFQEKEHEGVGKVGIHLIAARVKLGEEANGGLILLEAEEYCKRIREYLTFISVRRGWARSHSSWSLESLVMGSGRSRPELQLCDLLSNASYGDYRKSSSALRGQLEAGFGGYAFSLALRPLQERVEALLSDGAFAQALLTLAERSLQPDHGGGYATLIKNSVDDIVAHLAAMPAPWRRGQLEQLLLWIEQLIEQQRELTVGLAAIAWLESHLLIPLRDRLGSQGGAIASFAFALENWRLAACNHRGDVTAGRDCVERLTEMIPSLVGQWEDAPLLMRSLTLQAVHLTDCFEFDRAAELARKVDAYYLDLSYLFSDASDIFPERVRSERRGKALGTRVQAELYAGLQEPSRLEKARDASDAALAEFAERDHQRRQMQYRAQIETALGELAQARRYLAMSLDLSADSHESIAQVIQGLEPRQQGFPLLHWLRIGAAALRASRASEESSDFLRAFRAARLTDSDWCKGIVESYPAHGILRQICLIQAYQGDFAAAVGTLRRLQAITPTSAAMPLAAVLMAAQLELCGAMWEDKRAQAAKLLSNQTREQRGLQHLIADAMTRWGNGFPAFGNILQRWETLLGLAATGTEAPVGEQMRRAARVIGY